MSATSHIKDTNPQVRRRGRQVGEGQRHRHGSLLMDVCRKYQDLRYLIQKCRPGGPREALSKSHAIQGRRSHDHFALIVEVYSQIIARIVQLPPYPPSHPPVHPNIHPPPPHSHPVAALSVVPSGGGVGGGGGQLTLSLSAGLCSGQVVMMSDS